MSFLEGQDPHLALIVRSILSNLAFDACAYVDELLGLHAHRSWLFAEDMLEKLRWWILSLHQLIQVGDAPKKHEMLKHMILASSQDPKGIDLAVNLLRGYLGEFAALYCLMKNGYEVLPLTFVQWSSKRYPPSDIIILDSPQRRRFKVQNCPVFLEVTTGDIEDKLKAKISINPRS